VRQRRTRRRLVERQPILLVGENVLDRAIAIGAQPLRAVTRRFEAIGFNRVFKNTVTTAEVIRILRADLGIEAESAVGG